MKRQTKKWTLKGGKKIRVCDMSNNHLNNTIKLLEKNAEHRKMSTELFCSFCNLLRGKKAQRLFNQKFEKVMDLDFGKYTLSIYENMIAERERR